MGRMAVVVVAPAPQVGLYAPKDAAVGFFAEPMVAVRLAVAAAAAVAVAGAGVVAVARVQVHRP